MSLAFDKLKFDSMDAVPEGLRDLELYPKVTDMINFIVRQYAEEFEDISKKYTGPNIVRNRAIQEIVTELGFKYISDIMETIEDTEFNTLVGFISLVNLLKGSRTGLELILILLGFDSVIKEWWESSPKGPADTYQITVLMDANKVPNIDETLLRVQRFATAYVYPVMQNVDFRYTFSMAEKNLTMAGFARARYAGAILQRL